MSKNSPIEQEWDEAIAIVNFYMQAEGLNPSQLALRAGLNRSILSRFLGKKSFLDPASVLALYSAMQSSLDCSQKISFQRAAGLEKLLSELEKNAIYLVNVQPEIQALNPYKAALQQMAIAETNAVGSWEEAIFYYRKAEELFLHNAISHAAKAACKIVQMQINLGDYAAARHEIERIDKTYAMTKDLETEAELYRLNGWLDFHTGNYLRAKGYFEKQLHLAQEAGVKYFENSANGFLGRIYIELANQVASQKEKSALYYKALEHSERGRDFFIQQGWHEGIAMSTFRLSQVHQVSGNYREAKELRKRIRDMIGKNPFAHLDIEEARLRLDENNFPYTEFLVDRALDYLEGQKYARGICEALQLLASAELREGRPTSAFELAVAALCAAPTDSDNRGKKLWGFVKAIDRDRVWEGKWKSYEEYFRQLQESALAQSGNFKYLQHITFLDKNDILNRIFSRLNPEVSPK